jgi:hypothetical protein
MACPPGCSFLIAKAREENRVLRQKITEISTEGFEDDMVCLAEHLCPS